MICGAAFADPVASTALNDQTNNGTAYGTSQQQNFQINQNNNARETYGGGVSCAIPSLNFGVVGGDSYKAIATASVNIPLGDDACEKARASRIALMDYDLHIQKTEQNKQDILFQIKMANTCLELSDRVSIKADTPLAKECAKYSAANL